jgi:hypothetical protein
VGWNTDCNFCIWDALMEIHTIRSNSLAQAPKKLAVSKLAKKLHNPYCDRRFITGFINPVPAADKYTAHSHSHLFTTHAF